MVDSKSVRVFMHIVGALLAVIGLAHAVSIPLKDFGLIPGDVEWKTALIALFLILAAVEAFTMNMTKYAGDLLRSIAGRISGKAANNQ